MRSGRRRLGRSWRQLTLATAGFERYGKTTRSCSLRSLATVRSRPRGDHSRLPLVVRHGERDGEGCAGGARGTRAGIGRGGDVRHDADLLGDERDHRVRELLAGMQQAARVAQRAELEGEAELGPRVLARREDRKVALGKGEVPDRGADGPALRG